MAQTINVNTTPGQFMPTLYYSQGDIGREFEIVLASSDGWSIPAGATVTMVATKPSGFGFSVAGTLTDNVASFTTTETMTNEHGRYPAEIRITSNGDVIGTANFYLSGERDPHPAETIDGDASEIMPELTLLVERVEAAASSVLDMTVNASTLSAGSQATYSYDEETNTATFGIPQGEAGAGAAGVTASAYSSSRTYAVGDYVIHNSNLYRCTTAITTAEAFTAAHWTQVVLADDVSDVKSDFSQTMSECFGLDTEMPINGYSDNNTAGTTLNVAPFVLSQVVDNMIITAIRLKMVIAGTVSVGYVRNRPTSGTAYNADDVVVVNELTITTTGVATTVQLPIPFVVPEGGALFIGNNTDTGVWYYGTNGETKGFLYVSSGAYIGSGSSLGVDVFALPKTNFVHIDESYPSVENLTNILESDLYSNDYVPYDGYNASNASPSGSATSPFMVIPSAEGWVFSIKLKIQTTGVLHIGTIKASDVVNGSTFDFSKVEIHEKLIFTSTGEQVYVLKQPMKVESNELIVLTVRGDDATFFYGYGGASLGFYYVNGTTVGMSDAGLGVTFSGIKLLNEPITSVYEGKSLSILGDSISTFSGYIPEGNATYYPSGTVTQVSDTWWYKLYTALGMTLNVNNSWSGSMVTGSGASAGCGDRAEALGTSPDVIIVWMGINDFNNEVALGTYDGTTALPNVTTTFREAYAIMLNKILTKYQSSEVWVCTLPQCERNAETGFPEINGNGVALAEFNKAILELANAFGVKVLDHNKCGLTYQNMPTFNPDNLHPNKYGHSLVANNDIRQMDNLVRTRYSIS